MDSPDATCGSPAASPLTPHSSRLSRNVPFTWPVRVYYEDTDAAGVVYYAAYLRFMERARTEGLRALGFAQGELMASQGVAFVVRSAAIEFIKPALLDDELQVNVAVDRLGASLVVFSQQVLRGAELVASAKVKVACVKIEQFKPARIPAAIRHQLERLQPWAQA